MPFWLKLAWNLSNENQESVYSDMKHGLKHKSQEMGVTPVDTKICLSLQGILFSLWDLKRLPAFPGFHLPHNRDTAYSPSEYWKTTIRPCLGSASSGYTMAVPTMKYVLGSLPNLQETRLRAYSFCRNWWAWSTRRGERWLMTLTSIAPHNHMLLWGCGLGSLRTWATSCPCLFKLPIDRTPTLHIYGNW